MTDEAYRKQGLAKKLIEHVIKQYETKYIMTIPQKEELLSVMKEYTEADCYGKSDILSLYLDTSNFLLVRRSIEKPQYKEKLRVRSYGIADADTVVYLELKKKFNSIVYKRRENMREKQFEQYLATKVPCKNTQIMTCHFAVQFMVSLL